jgi:hypothetical protein
MRISDKNTGHFARQLKYILLFPATFNYHKSTLSVKWYQALRIAEEVQTLSEGTTMRRNAHIAYPVRNKPFLTGTILVHFDNLGLVAVNTNPFFFRKKIDICF